MRDGGGVESPPLLCSRRASLCVWAAASNEASLLLPVWQGPIPAEPCLRSFGFLPADKPHADVRHHAALASP